MTEHAHMPNARPGHAAHALRHAEPGERVERVHVMRWWDYPIFVVLSVVGFATIGFFALTWMENGDLALHPQLFLLVSALLALILINQQGRWFLLLVMRRPKPMVAPSGLRVAVVTTYVPAAEPLDMLEHSLRALVAIESPHDTWLLDEGDGPDVRALCERLGVHHFTRRNRPEYQSAEGTFKAGSKHGNYNAWLHEIGFARYDVLSAFDPDHVPHPSYLTRTLGCFRDASVAYVQPAQAYYNQRAGLISRGAAEETYAYYSTIQMACDGLGYSIIVGGHNLHRMKALESVGGLAAHDADDLLLTLKYRAAGWKGVYVPHILARGLTPVDWRSYLQQQRRWARSVLDIKMRRWDKYSRSLPLATKLMSLAHGINFMHRSIVGLAAMTVLITMLAIGGTHNFLRAEMIWPVALLVGVIHVMELYRQRFYLDWRSEAGPHWRAMLLEYVKWPWLILAMIDVLRGARPAYATTWKTRRTGVYRPFVIWHAAVSVAILVAWRIGRISDPLAHPFFVVVGAIAVTLNVVLIGIELRGFPPPFDVRLWRPIRVTDDRP